MQHTKVRSCTDLFSPLRTTSFCTFVVRIPLWYHTSGISVHYVATIPRTNALFPTTAFYQRWSSQRSLAFISTVLNRPSSRHYTSTNGESQLKFLTHPKNPHVITKEDLLPLPEYEKIRTHVLQLRRQIKQSRRIEVRFLFLLLVDNSNLNR
jgi:hypothetical protein